MRRVCELGPVSGAEQGNGAQIEFRVATGEGKGTILVGVVPVSVREYYSKTARLSTRPPRRRQNPAIGTAAVDCGAVRPVGETPEKGAAMLLSGCALWRSLIPPTVSGLYQHGREASASDEPTAAYSRTGRRLRCWRQSCRDPAGNTRHRGGPPKGGRQPTTDFLLRPLKTFSDASWVEILFRHADTPGLYGRTGSCAISRRTLRASLAMAPHIRSRLSRTSRHIRRLS